MNHDDEPQGEHGSTEYEDMFRCSRCGFARQSVETVIVHLEAAHDGRGQIREYEREKQSVGLVGQVLQRINGLLKRLSG